MAQTFHDGHWNGVSQGRDVWLIHRGRIILHEQARSAHAATARAWELLDQARRGLVEPIPYADAVRRLAERPLRAKEAQNLQTDGLPLFGDARLQTDWLDGASMAP